MELAIDELTPPVGEGYWVILNHPLPLGKLIDLFIPSRTSLNSTKILSPEDKSVEGIVMVSVMELS